MALRKQECTQATTTSLYTLKSYTQILWICGITHSVDFKTSAILAYMILMEHFPPLISSLFVLLFLYSTVEQWRITLSVSREVVGLQGFSTLVVAVHYTYQNMCEPRGGRSPRLFNTRCCCTLHIIKTCVSREVVGLQGFSTLVVAVHYTYQNMCEPRGGRSPRLFNTRCCCTLHIIKTCVSREVVGLQGFSTLVVAVHYT